jgi:hypothetical protein
MVRRPGQPGLGPISPPVCSKCGLIIPACKCNAKITPVKEDRRRSALTNAGIKSNNIYESHSSINSFTNHTENDNNNYDEDEDEDNDEWDPSAETTEKNYDQNISNVHGQRSSFQFHSESSNFQPLYQGQADMEKRLKKYSGRVHRFERISTWRHFMRDNYLYSFVLERYDDNTQKRLPPIAVKLLADKPVEGVISEGDMVAVDGKWQKKDGFFKAKKLFNETKQTGVKLKKLKKMKIGGR